MFVYYAEIFKLVLVVIIIIAIWKIGQLSAESFYDWLRGKIWPKGKWIMIDSTELLNTLKDGDKIKYTFWVDRIPYNKGTIRQIEIEHYKEFKEIAHRIYIKTTLGTDMLLLNCMTGYEIPYLGRGSILYLYRWQTEDVKIHNSIYPRYVSIEKTEGDSGDILYLIDDPNRKTQPGRTIILDEKEYSISSMQGNRDNSQVLLFGKFLYEKT